MLFHVQLASDAAGEEIIVTTNEVKEQKGGDSESQNLDELLFFVDASGDTDVDKPSQVQYQPLDYIFSWVPYLCVGKKKPVHLQKKCHGIYQTQVN